MKKKSKIPTVFALLISAFVCAFVLYIVLAPAPRHKGPAGVRVPVTQAPEEEIEPKGDEKQVASIIAPPPSVMEPKVTLPPGHNPLIAIVIDDMGLNLNGSQRAMKLPGFITLSFMPYAERLDEQAAQAQEGGHELLLHMPMEPVGHEDPGPGALLTRLGPDEIRARFDKALGSFDGFDGVNNHMGSKFTADVAGMEIVISELHKRNLFFLDSRTSAKSVGALTAQHDGVPNVSRDVFLDDVITPEAVHAQLMATERVARRKGYAIAIGHPHDVTLRALEQWIPEAEKDGFEFVAVRKLVEAKAHSE